MATRSTSQFPRAHSSVRARPLARFLRRAAGVLVCAQAAGCALLSDPTAPPEVHLSAREVRLPARWVADYPLLEARVDGKGPFWFILDTGAGVSAVNRDVKPGAGRRGRALEIRDSSGRSRDARTLDVTLQIGDARFSGAQVAVLDLSALSAAIGHRLDGIAGYPLFETGLLTIDYPRKEVRFGRDSLPPPDGDTVFALLEGPLPAIPIDLGGLEQPFLIDTGSLETLAMASWPPHLRFRSGPVPISVSVALHGGVRVEKVGRLDADVRIGRHILARPLVQSSAEGRRVGAGLLRHFELALDGRKRRVRLRRDRDDPIAMESVIGTGMITEPRFGYWLVLDVIEGSPADRAGVRKGDRVLRVDGMPVDRLASVSDWRWASAFRFTIERKGRDQDFFVAVEELIP